MAKAAEAHSTLALAASSTPRFDSQVSALLLLLLLLLVGLVGLGSASSEGGGKSSHRIAVLQNCCFVQQAL
jgi:hypothetical protein